MQDDPNFDILLVWEVGYKNGAPLDKKQINEGHVFFLGIRNLCLPS